MLSRVEAYVRRPIAAVLAGAALGALVCGPARAEALSRLIPPPGLPESTGISIHGAPTRAPGEFEQFVGSGVRLVRLDLFWASVEREPGVYDFSAHDQMLSMFFQRGMRVLLILCYGNELYGLGNYDLPSTDESRAAFARFTAAAAEHFRGQPVIFELWNEPDGRISPAD